jgi:hypothetical protein
MRARRFFRSRLGAHPTEFIEVVLQIRASLNTSNWKAFVAKFFYLSGIKLPLGNLQWLGPPYKRRNAPTPELLYLLTRPGLFVFANQEAITFESMYEVYFGDRNSRGDLR